MENYTEDDRRLLEDAYINLEDLVNLNDMSMIIDTEEVDQIQPGKGLPKPLDTLFAEVQVMSQLAFFLIEGIIKSAKVDHTYIETTDLHQNNFEFAKKIQNPVEFFSNPSNAKSAKGLANYIQGHCESFERSTALLKAKITDFEAEGMSDELIQDLKLALENINKSNEQAIRLINYMAPEDKK